MPDAVNPDRNSLVYVYPGDDGPADGDVIQFNAATGRWEAVQGGGSAPTNWCVINLANGGPLTVADNNYTYMEADLSIADQSGSDFSVGTFQGNGAVFSASGGRFQFAPFITPATNATLDAGHADQRWLQFSAAFDSSVPNPLINGSGGDLLIPVLKSAVPNANEVAVMAASVIGYALPGAVALANINVYLVNGQGTDSVPLTQAISQINIWQV